MTVPTVTFNDGHQMPTFGLGTCMSKPGEVADAVKYAIEVGYRHIDTAYFYENEKEIGEAIREKINDNTIKREDIFITTKLWCNSHKENEVVPACKQSLKNLGLDYVDLYLVHYPIAFKSGEVLTPRDSTGKIEFSDTDYLETWRGMEECKRQGLARSIGVSNFDSEQIARLVASAQIKPVNNQIEITLSLQQKSLIEFCKDHEIAVTGYSLNRLDNRYGIKNDWDEPCIEELANKYKKTPVNVACKYILQLGVTLISKSIIKSTIKEVFEIFDFSLTTEDMSVIEGMGIDTKFVTSDRTKKSKYYSSEETGVDADTSTREELFDNEKKSNSFTEDVSTAEGSRTNVKTAPSDEIFESKYSSSQEINIVAETGTDERVSPTDQEKTSARQSSEQISIAQGEKVDSKETPFDDINKSEFSSEEMDLMKETNSSEKSTTQVEAKKPKYYSFTIPY